MTGQHPKRRESDSAAEKRLARMAEKLAEGTYRQPARADRLPPAERPNADLTGHAKDAA